MPLLLLQPLTLEGMALPSLGIEQVIPSEGRQPQHTRVQLVAGGFICLQEYCKDNSKNSLSFMYVMFPPVRQILISVCE